MKKNYILGLSILASGLLLFSSANSIFAACGPEPFSNCSDVCDNFTYNTPQYYTCWDPCEEKYTAADDKFRKCQQDEYDKYMAAAQEKSNYEDQGAAAKKQLDEDTKICNDALGTLAQKESDCVDDCIAKGNTCRDGCQDPNFSYPQKSDCVNIKCKKIEDTCKTPCRSDYFRDSQVEYVQCLEDASNRYNQKMDLINQHNWPDLQKMLDQDYERAQQKKAENEKAQLDQAKANDPDITTITQTNGHITILQPDGSFKDVYSETDIKDGDRIWTGDGNAVLTYADGTKIDVGPNSSFTYSSSKISTELSLEKNALDKKINLYLGKLKFIVQKQLGNKFQVITSQGAGAIRGTEFIVDANADRTMFYLYEGSLDVTNLKNGSIQLQAGQAATIDNSGKITSGKLDQGQWDQLSGEITTPQSAQQGVAGQPSGKTIIWLVTIVVLVCGAGAVVFARRKR